MVVVPLVKSAAASKFAVLAVVPDKYLTIFIVEPASDRMKVEVKEVLLAWAVVRVTEPGVADVKVALAPPRDVGVTPLMVAAASVATLEKLTLTR